MLRAVLLHRIQRSGYDIQAFVPPDQEDDDDGEGVTRQRPLLPRPRSRPPTS
ncbi:hypothetical protein [Streptomyces melanogenes]|uniref:hypothetical protein n=1 Tax=Streptomyces melanogenes TaxID=67326 RepID=UPI003792B6A5